MRKNIKDIPLYIIEDAVKGEEYALQYVLWKGVCITTHLYWITRKRLFMYIKMRRQQKWLRHNSYGKF